MADISKEYFEWMYDLVCDGRYPKDISYKNLLKHLHQIEFTYTILKDENRAADGINLRYRFKCDSGHSKSKSSSDIESDKPCSVLEMLIALAMKCEESIMDDPNVGDRTGQWFWNMIVNLGLGGMIDSRYDKKFVDMAIAIFLNREYASSGEGGLFTIKHCKYDLRKIEIWQQLCYYLDTIT